MVDHGWLKSTQHCEVWAERLELSSYTAMFLFPTWQWRLSGKEDLQGRKEDTRDTTYSKEFRDKNAHSDTNTQTGNNTLVCLVLRSDALVSIRLVGQQ